MLLGLKSGVGGFCWGVLWVWGVVGGGVGREGGKGRWSTGLWMMSEMAVVMG